MKTLVKLGLPIFTLLLASVLLVGTASAHSRLKSSTPSDGETLTAEPTSVSAVYGEETSLSQSIFEVYFTAAGSSAQVRADNGDGKVDVNDRAKMSATLKAGLGDGSYLVKWRTVTEDDNGTVDGSFSFKVASAATASGPTGQTGAQQESGGDDDAAATTTNLPKTGNGGDNLLPLLGLLAVLVAGAGLTLRRQAVR